MNTISYQAITYMINTDLATSRQLLALLEQEAAATQSRNFEVLSQLIEQKNGLMKNLKENAETRSQWLKAVNQPVDEQHWLAFLDQFNEVDIHEQWQDMKATIEKCQKINEINGKVVQRGIKCHEQLLRLMRGNPASADLYNSQGKKQTVSSGGRVAEA